MFTIEQIKTAHAKVKTGADYPAYVHSIIQLGVTRYETYVKDGRTTYMGMNNYYLHTEATLSPVFVAEKSNRSIFIEELKKHQQGKTDFATFRKMCAETGIEKWVADLKNMTCTYLDKAGNELYKEAIPFLS